MQAERKKRKMVSQKHLRTRGYKVEGGIREITCESGNCDFEDTTFYFVIEI